MLQGEHSAILLTFIKLPLSLRSLFYKCIYFLVAVLHRFYCRSTKAKDFKRKIVYIFLPIGLNMCFCTQKSCFIEMVFLSTDNICLLNRIQKNYSIMPNLSRNLILV